MAQLGRVLRHEKRHDRCEHAGTMPTKRGTLRMRVSMVPAEQAATPRRRRNLLRRVRPAGVRGDVCSCRLSSGAKLRNPAFDARLERGTGFESASLAWETDVISTFPHGIAANRTPPLVD